jgi:hypothetical protein
MPDQGKFAFHGPRQASSARFVRRQEAEEIGSAMARTYLYLGMDTPTDEKLLARPVVERHLWTCLLCLAKHAQVESGDPTIRGQDAKILAGRFNLGPTKGVQAGIDYFKTAKPRPLIEVDDDGAIHIVNFIEWQGEYDAAAERQAAKERQRRSRASRRDNRDKSQESRLLAVTVAVKDVVSSKSGESERRDFTACESVDNSPSKAEKPEDDSQVGDAAESLLATIRRRGAK